MQGYSPSPLRLVLGGVALLLTTALAHGQVRVVNSVISEEVQTSQTSIRAQAQIDRLSDQTAELLGEYRAVLQQLDRVEIYNQHLGEVVDDQESSKADVTQKLENYQRTKQEIVPLMNRMIDTLDKFVELDLPFHLYERRERVQRLRDNMGSAEITISEKFRQLMDAYQIEMDFGRDIDAYTGWLEVNGPRREVNFLRVGRLVLAYQTQDRNETGFFNPVTRAWETLPDQYRNHVADGLRIARKQAAPDLLKLPVQAPEVAQ
ncbi:MAG: DUF3450 domain-containing protein [Gammaproteobacteria bacterium]|nr:DUF3450 domain-containing protein [Gammaproteobacteria bacterium]